MNILEITIQHSQEKGWPVVAEYTRPGELPRRSEGLLSLPEGYDRKLLELALDQHGYGTYLGKELFRDTIRDGFREALSEAKANNDPLRILLVIEAPDLKPLRWERLCAPTSSGRWNFLALDQNNPFSLYLPSLTDRRFPPVGRRDLRALVLLADPPEGNTYNGGLAVFDAQATADSIGQALGKIPYELLGPVDKAIGPASIDALCEQITKQQYTFLHIVAHGWYDSNDKEQDTFIYLLDDQHNVAPIASRQLIERLDRCAQLPHLTFLCTCESAKPEAEEALGGLAQQLIRELGMPAVVAMTDPVSIATAEKLAAAFYSQLRQHGQPDQALTEAAAGLQGRADILVPALFSRLGGRPLFSDDLGDRSMTKTEIKAGLAQLEELFPVRAPILKQKLKKHAETLSATLGTDRKNLSDAARQDHDTALDAINGLSERVLDHSFPAVALGNEIPTYNSACPFPGLKAFQTDEQQFFFGRDKKTEELITRLHTRLQDKDKKFLAVLGASGSGKSSLVLAGMIPALKKQAEEKGGSLQIHYLTPGSEPEKTLTRQLAIPSQPGQTILLLVDQFEELFTLCTDPAARKAFLDKLLNTRNEQPDLSIILTMRADFWGDCAPYPELKKLMQAHQELLAPMTTAELRTAMEQQASSVKLRFEGGLSHTILSEVENEPGAMPLLQHLLLELWKRRHGRWLMTSEYDNLGGIKKAIGRTADAFYDELREDKDGGKDGQSLLRNLFVRLTRLDKTAENVEQQRDTRQRVNLEELLSLNPDPERVRMLVNRLADARLLVKDTDPETEETNIEVAHEALIRHWERLRTWVNEDRESWMLLASVRQQAQDWEKGGKKEGDLPRWGERLQEAAVLFGRERFAQSELEKEFLQVCRALSDKEKVKETEYLAGLKRRLTIAVVGIVAAVALAAVAGWQRQRAVEQSNIAQKNEHDAKHQLAMTYWNNGIHERDTESGSSLKALHYFAKAEKVFTKNKELEAVRQVRFSEIFIARAIRLSALITGGTGQNIQATFNREGDLFLTWSHASDTIRIWNSSTSQVVATLVHSGGGCRGAAFNGDSSRVLTWNKMDVRVWDTATGKSLTALGYGSMINDAKFNRQGNIILTQSSYGPSLWNADSGAPLFPEIKFSGAIFNADGSLILTWNDNVVRVLDSITGNELSPAIECYDIVLGAVFTRDDGRILTWSKDGSACIWDNATGKLLTTLKLNNEKIDYAVFNNDGSQVVTLNYGRSPCVWDTSTGKMIAAIKYSPSSGASEIWRATFSGNSNRIFAQTHEGFLYVWDSRTGEELTVPANKEYHYGGLIINKNGSQILSWSRHEDKPVYIWDTSTDDLLISLENSGKINGVLLNTAGSRNRILIKNDDGTIYLYDCHTEKALSPVLKFKHTSYIRSAKFNSDGSRVLTWSEEEGVRIWDSINGELLDILPEDNGSIKDVKFNSVGSRILIRSEDGTARIWNSSTGTPLSFLLKHKKEHHLTGAIFSTDGNRVLTWSDGEGALIWDSDTGDQLTPLLKHNESGLHAEFNSNGSRTLTYSNNGTVRVWDNATGNKLFSVSISGQLRDATFNNDGTRIIIKDSEGVRAWDSTTGKLLNPLPEQYYTAISFSADHSRMLTRDIDGVRVRDSNTGKELTPLLEHKEVSGALFEQSKGPNKEKYILTWSRENFRIWDNSTGKSLTPILNNNGGPASSFDDGKGRKLTWNWNNEGSIFHIWDSTIGDISFGSHFGNIWQPRWRLEQK